MEAAGDYVALPRDPVDLPADAIVIRFSPFEEEGVMRAAERSSRHYMNPEDPDAPKIHRLSVFADIKREGESDDDVRRRLVTAAELSGINMSNNKALRFGRAADVQGEGLRFWKDGYPGERPEHYSLDLGPDLDKTVVRKVVKAFPGKEAVTAP